MSFEEIDLPEEEINDTDNEEKELAEDAAPTGKFEKILGEGGKKYKLSGMFREWYIDYSSYTVLYRAVPHLIDGLPCFLTFASCFEWFPYHLKNATMGGYSLIK